jgi:hypothetical protein
MRLLATPGVAALQPKEQAHNAQGGNIKHLGQQKQKNIAG